MVATRTSGSLNSADFQRILGKNIETLQPTASQVSPWRLFMTTSLSCFANLLATFLFRCTHALQRATLHLPVCRRLGYSSSQRENSDLARLLLHCTHGQSSQQVSHRALSGWSFQDLVFLKCMNATFANSWAPQSWHILIKQAFAHG